MNRFQLFKLFNALVGLIPRPILSRLLKAMWHHPDIPDRVGYTVYPQVFYSPFPIPSEVDLVKLKEKRELPGVNFNMEESGRLLEQAEKYAGEISEFLKTRKGNTAAWDITYPIVDSGTCFAMLRHIKPKRYIEVGCGFSSSCSAAALAKNKSEGHNCKATYIDPFPSPHLANVELPGEFLKKKIETVPLSLFQELESGDVLFIDTSHVIKVQNDVEFELIHILPSLKPGVIVHVHDIFSPYDYPVYWLVGEGTQRGGINEQYALECLLSGGNGWDVILPVYMLWLENRVKLSRVVDDEYRPAAIWIRKLR